MIKTVIDTDPGTDDAIALMMALNSPDLDIQGLTTTGGNASVAHTTRNALRLVSAFGRPQLPISMGASRPVRGKFQYGYYYHGKGGMTIRLPNTDAKPRQLRAPEYLMSIGYSFPNELVIFALGPLTNIARALRREPRMKEWIKEIVVMGGAVEVPGNVTPYAEFNIYNDPLAAHEVFSTEIPITLVGLDVCNQVLVTRNDVGWPYGSSTSERLMANMLSRWFETHPDHDSYNLCDPVAILAGLHPDLFGFRQASVTVEVEDQERLGQTRAVYGAGNVKVATEIDGERAMRVVRDLLAKS